MRLEIRSTADRAACIERLRAVERRACEPCTAEEMAEGCELLDVVEGGEVVGAVAVELAGAHATIKAAAARGQHTYAELGMIERELRARGIRSVGMFTRRRALVDRLEGRGYRLVSVEAVLSHVEFQMQKGL